MRKEKDKLLEFIREQSKKNRKPIGYFGVGGFVITKKKPNKKKMKDIFKRLMRGDI